MLFRSAGKTSLLEVLCGLRQAESGRVSRAADSDRCHWIGHRNALNVALTPFENLQFWCELNGEPTHNVRAALREFGLQRASDVPCRQLSAGQQRRTALARLAVARRELWLLDEPLSALDEAGVHHWISLVAGHVQRGGAVVVTSHQALPDAVPSVRAWELPT